DRWDEVPLPPLDEGDLPLDRCSPIPLLGRPTSNLIQSLVHCRLDDTLVEGARDGVQQRIVNDLLADLDIVRADGRAALVVVAAAVEVPPLCAVAARHGDDCAATFRAPGHPTQQIARLEIQPGRVPQKRAVLGGPGKGVSGLRQSLVCRLPELVRDDSEVGGVKPNPFLSRALLLFLGPAAADLLALVPDDLASV